MHRLRRSASRHADVFVSIYNHYRVMFFSLRSTGASSAANKSKGVHPHPYPYLSLILNHSKARWIPQSFQRTVWLNIESQPGYWIIDDFASRISFDPCIRNNDKEKELHLSKLDCLCEDALSNPKTTILVTDPSVRPQPHLQALSIVAGWKSGFQILSSKAVLRSITVPNAGLVAIPTGISKASALEANQSL